jgi:hypothetical protein
MSQLVKYFCKPHPEQNMINEYENDYISFSRSLVLMIGKFGHQPCRAPCPALPCSALRAGQGNIFLNSFLQGSERRNRAQGRAKKKCPVTVSEGYYIG